MSVNLSGVSNAAFFLVDQATQLARYEKTRGHYFRQVHVAHVRDPLIGDIWVDATGYVVQNHSGENKETGATKLAEQLLEARCRARPSEFDNLVVSYGCFYERIGVDHRFYASSVGSAG